MMPRESILAELMKADAEKMGQKNKKIENYRKPPLPTKESVIIRRKEITRIVKVTPGIWREALLLKFPDATKFQIDNDLGHLRARGVLHGIRANGGTRYYPGRRPE